MVTSGERPADERSCGGTSGCVCVWLAASSLGTRNADANYANIFSPVAAKTGRRGHYEVTWAYGGTIFMRMAGTLVSTRLDSGRAGR